jgi:hypothetical protein
MADSHEQECMPCGFNSYADASGSSACTACAAHTHAIARNDAHACRCDAGYVCRYLPRTVVLHLSYVDSDTLLQDIAAAAGVAVEAVRLR